MRRPFFRKTTYCRALDRKAKPDALRDSYLVMHKAKTIADYRRALLPWTERCARMEIPDLPSDSDDLLEFLLEWMQDQHPSYTMVRLFMSALSCLHVSNRYELKSSPEIRAFLKKMQRSYVRQPAEVASLAELHKMCDLADEEPDRRRGARNKAMLLFAWESAERPIEYSKAFWEHLMPVARAGKGGGLLWERLANARAVIVKIPNSKGDQGGRGQRVTIKAKRDPKYCAVRALAEWCRLSGRVRGAIFPRIWRGGKIGTAGVHTSTVRRLIADHSVTLMVHRVPYGIRRGRATHDDRRGVPRQRTKRLLRHEDDATTDLYIDRGEGDDGGSGSAFFK